MHSHPGHTLPSSPARPPCPSVSSVIREARQRNATSRLNGFFRAFVFRAFVMKMPFDCGLCWRCARLLDNSFSRVRLSTLRHALAIFVVAFFAALLATSESSAQTRAFTGELKDGTSLNGREMSGPPESPADAQLDGTPLFAPGKELVWLRNRGQPSTATPSSFIEMTNGDILTGDVSHHIAAGAGPAPLSYPHLVVSSLTAVDWPGRPRWDSYGNPRGKKATADRGTVRVDLTQVRRVVWNRRAAENSVPKTVYCRDGRILPYLSLRWETTSIKILREEGPLEITFDDLLEICLNATDPWQAQIQQLAKLCPDLNGRLAQFESADGMRITCGENWYQMPVIFKSPAAEKADRWLRVVLPVWSADVFWLDVNKMSLSRYFEATQIPLTSITPGKVQQSTGLAASWRPQRDRNVQGGLLLANGQEFGWGFGVHALNKIEFPLPPLAKAFRTRVALDHIAGTGGCAQGLVSLRKSDGEKQLFASPVLVGSRQIADTGRLELADVGKPNRVLVLTADPAVKNTPAGADPLEVNDMLDWLEPTIELDRARLLAEVQPLAATLAEKNVELQLFKPLVEKFAPGFDLAGLPGQKIEEWKDKDQPDRKVLKVPAVSPELPCVLRRVLAIPAGKVTKLLIEGKRSSDHPWQIRPTVAGQALDLKTFNNPAGQTQEYDLSPYAGRTVAVELNLSQPSRTYSTTPVAYFLKIEVASTDPPKPPEDDKK